MLGRHPVDRLDLSELGGPAGLTALAGPHTPVASELAHQLRTGRLVACIDGRHDPRPVIVAAKQWHAWFGVPTWVVCRITRPLSGHHGTLLEAGCAYRAAKLIGSDAGWEVVGPSASHLVAFARYVDGTAIIVADALAGHARRRRRFPLEVARAGPVPVVLADDACPPVQAGRHLTRVT